MLNEERALFLLENAEYGVLSLNAGDAGAYGIPLNFVWDKKESLYFHCAPVGRKLELAAKNNRGSFCLVGDTHVVSRQFTTRYESVILAGTLHTHLDDSEKWHALELLLDKYSPADKETGMKYAAGSFGRTAVMRLDILTWSGKGKRVRQE